MAKQRAGRIKRRSVGVKVLRLTDGRHVARWADPLTGKQVQQSLDRLGLSSDATRRSWALKKSEQLAQLRQAVALGAARAVRATVREAVAEYLDGVAHAPTRESKRLPLESLADRLEQVGSGELANLTGPILIAAWRDWVTSPKRNHAPGTRNRWLAVAGSFLRWARRRGMAPLLTIEAIADAGERLPKPVEAIEFLRPPELRQVLLAALAHDAADRRGRRVAPFVLGLLLSGCRLRELGNLTWREVEADGIYLAADRTKTRRARVVTIAETPSLGLLLDALRPADADPDALVFPGAVAGWESALQRLVARHGSPVFTAHGLRRTCGTLLTNSPGIYHGASAWHSAKRLGHSVEQAERDYAGQLPGLPVGAKTLEAAAGIEDLCEQIVASVTAGR